MISYLTCHRCGKGFTGVDIYDCREKLQAHLKKNHDPQKENHGD